MKVQINVRRNLTRLSTEIHRKKRFCWKI